MLADLLRVVCCGWSVAGGVFREFVAGGGNELPLICDRLREVAYVQLRSNFLPAVLIPHRQAALHNRSPDTRNTPLKG